MREKSFQCEHFLVRWQGTFHVFKRETRVVPTIYNLVEEIAVMQDLLLVKVHVYQSGSVLRANLYFKSKKGEIVLRNYRASDSIALAAYYDIPIKVRKGLFEEAIER